MPASRGNLIPRHKVLAFYGLPVGQSGSSIQWIRMHYFTEMSMTKNPEEYERKYVDEATKRTDIVGYAPSISYAFDKHKSDSVLDDIIGITNYEKTGEEAVRYIAWIDLSNEGTGAIGYFRRYTIIPDSEGDDENTYTYSGEFKACGELETARFTSTDNWETATQESN